jgi:hypothetical protein
LIENLHCLQARRPEHATRNDWYMALAYTVRDRALDGYIATLEPVTVAGPAMKVVLKVVFLPDFNVKSSHHVYPAADLSEQISTAGKEASGTGNMKFAMNGALTIGTLDGANVEIREAVGAANFFLFGLTAAEVVATRAAGYHPRAYYESNAELREALDLIADGFFTNGDRDVFRPLVESLLTRDDYLPWPTTSRMSTVRAGSATPIATRPIGRACRSSTPRASAASRPTVRSATTAVTSGTSRLRRLTRDDDERRRCYGAERIRRATRQRRASWGHGSSRRCQLQSVLEARDADRTAAVRRW